MIHFHTSYNMIEAARTNKIKHFVHSSVLLPSLRKLLHHKDKRHVEEALIESGLRYTILQPSNFMDNFPIQKLLYEDNPCVRHDGTQTSLSPILAYTT